MRSEVTARTKAPVHVYSVRRVNPFRGVYQVVETPAGRAISANGVVWDIEVSAECSPHPGSRSQRNELAYIRYGLWSVDDGLVSRPLSPSMGGDELSRQCRQVINVIERNIDHLPFPLEDSHELWLFDSDRETPIALLASKLPTQKAETPEPRYWAGSVGAQGVPSQHRFEHCKTLEELVRERAGFNIHKCWVQRQADGNGRTPLADETIAGENFPTFLITEDWPQREQADLVQEYINWISPSLLTLQHLDAIQRQRLEQNLHIQAVSVEHHWRLYPTVLDARHLKSARVQGRLQNA